MYDVWNSQLSCMLQQMTSQPGTLYLANTRDGYRDHYPSQGLYLGLRPHMSHAPGHD